MDFLDRLIDWIEGNVELFTLIEKSRMRNKGPAIAIRQTPTPPSTRYMDGSKLDNFGFQVLVRHNDVQKATDTIYAITKAVDGLNGDDIKSENNSFELVQIEVYTNPNHVETNDRNEEIYTALFVAQLYTN
ncbi:hypothetical protein H1D32_13365 [Anaerobacillus sp. CMMVII]|uniref:minor capsid protein n=1 Tax=Anaerobacillus sp. CMMVII TaxID=2755588 RepID=UPI0021B705A1|nr:minor capsid protein [Anaerobacillus sp. CMMVII]MCT8138643.1 hypothetical protein [Anaerobacillus sp. CMMVII]